MSRDEYTRRFEGRSEAYSRYRPRYPQEVIKILRDEIGLDSRAVVADVGSGTGFLSELFLENGNRVYCIEPNRDMRTAAEARLQGYAPRFLSVDGRAEATGLGAGSVDLVTAGQALHWFAPTETRVEFDRILKRHGPVVIIYNHRREDDPPGRAYAELVERYAGDRAPVPDMDDAYIAMFLGNDLFKKFVMPNSQILDLEGFLGRLASASYMPKEGDSRWAGVREDALAIINEHGSGGRVTLHYHTAMYLGAVRPGPL